MSMASYIAFKALRICRDGVYSPHRYTKWDEVYAPALGRLTYSLRTASLEGNQGVYAGTFSEAWFYMVNECRLFLVTPDPDAETEVGTMGWRTTCAIVIGEVTSLQDAARLITASHQAGYPQIKEILAWARAFTQRPPWTAEKVRRVLAHHAPRLGVAKVFDKWVVFDESIGLAQSGRRCGKRPRDVLAEVLEYHEAMELGVIDHHE